LRHKVVMAVWVGASARMPISGSIRSRNLSHLGSCRCSSLRARDPPHLRAGPGGDGFGDFEAQGVAPLAEAGHDDALARPGAFQGACTSISRLWAVPVSPQIVHVVATVFGAAPSFLAMFLCSAVKKQG
jgi:hypothetical protein